jgi:hypothetical protein
MTLDYQTLKDISALVQPLANIGVGIYAGIAHAQGGEFNTALTAGTLAATSIGKGAIVELDNYSNPRSMQLLEILGFGGPISPLEAGVNSTIRNTVLGSIEMGLGYGIGYSIGKLI